MSIDRTGFHRFISNDRTKYQYVCYLETDHAYYLFEEESELMIRFSIIYTLLFRWSIRKQHPCALDSKWMTELL